MVAPFGPIKHVEIGEIWIDVSVQESHGAGAEVTEHPVEFGSNVADHIRPLPRMITIEGIVTNHPIRHPLSHMGESLPVGTAIALDVARDPARVVPPTSGNILGEPDVGLIGIIPGIDQGVALLGALGINPVNKIRLAAQQTHLDTTSRSTLAATGMLHYDEPFNRVLAVHAALLEIIDTSQLVKVVTGLVTYESVGLTDLQIERSGELGRDVLKFTATGRVLRIVSSGTAKLPDPVHARVKPAQSAGKQAAPEVPEAETPAAAEDAMSIGAKLKEAADLGKLGDFF